MSFVLSLADSEVRSVEPQGDGLRVAFSAAQVQSVDETGYVQALELVFDQATWTGSPADAVGRLRDARLWVDGARWSPITPPCTATGAVRAELLFGNGTVLSVQAAAAHWRFTGDPRFQVSMAC